MRNLAGSQGSRMGNFASRLAWCALSHKGQAGAQEGDKQNLRCGVVGKIQLARLTKSHMTDVVSDGSSS